MALVDDHYGEYSERRSESRRHGRDGRHERPRRRNHTGENIPWTRIRRAPRPLMFPLVKQMSREILETVAKAGEFDQKPWSGIAFQIAI